MPTDASRPGLSETAREYRTQFFILAGVAGLVAMAAVGVVILALWWWT